jgi:hypothetical protein
LGTGVVSVGVSANGAPPPVSDAQVDYEYLREVFVWSVSPAFASVGGGLMVAVDGYNFPDTTALSCRFNESVTAARWISRTRIQCLTPVLNASGIVSLAVSGNGVDFSPTKDMPPVLIAMQQLPEVWSVVPAVVTSIPGATVTLRGANFFFTSDLICRLGSIDVPAQYVNDTAIQCVLDEVDAGSYNVSASCNGHEFSAMNSSATVVVKPGVRLLSLFPPSGTVAGGTVVSLVGENFTETVGNLSCLFGSVMVPATVLSDRKLQCLAPPMASAGMMTVGVVRGAEAISLTSRLLSFEYLLELMVFSVSPLLSSWHGGASVTITGFAFSPNADLECLFGNLTAPARWFSPSQLICVTPPLPAAEMDATSVPLSLGLNGVDFKPLGLNLTFLPSVEITSISPALGLISGGTPIILGLSGLTAVKAKVECLFSWTSMWAPKRVATVAIIVNSSDLHCVTPQGDEGPANVSVVADGIVLSEIPADFTFIGTPTIASVEPQSGTRAGGTVVNFTGEGFVGSLLSCSFGGRDPVAGRVLSPELAQCVTPPLGDGPELSSVSISLNGLDRIATGSFFRYVADPTLWSLSPLSGPAAGGTDVLVAGYFSQGVTYRCRFGDFGVVLGQLISSTGLVCTAPAAATANGSVALGVSMNGNEWVGNLTFEYYPLLSLTAVVPASGSLRGGMELAIHGAGFFPSPGLSCLFRSAAAEVEVPAVFSDEGSIKCVSPAWRAGANAVTLLVSANGVDFSGNLTYVYTEAPLVLGLSPSQGYTTGSTLVEVSGRGFRNTSTLQCRFGGLNGSSVPASFVSAEALRCIAPPYEMTSPDLSESVSVEVSFDGADWVAAEVDFEYLPDPVIFAIRPRTGSLLGGTPVYVLGANFVDGGPASLLCSFGDQTSPARWLSAQAVECSTPPGPAAGTVPFRVSINGEDFSQEDVAFTYVETAVLKSVSPAWGPASGGIELTVTGAGFVYSSTLACQFEKPDGQLVVQGGTYLGPDKMSCTLPAMVVDAEINCTLSVTNNGEDVSLGLPFIVRPSVSVHSVFPLYGGAAGGTVLSITGSNFFPLDSYQWAFSNGGNVSASFVSETELQCVTPAIAVAPADVGLTLVIEGGYNITVGSRFTYLAEAEVWRAIPSWGPPSGGTAVVLVGDNFVDTEALSCLFDGEVSGAARWLSAGQVECISPADSANQTARPVNVTVTLNGLESVKSTAEFEYYPGATVSSISPASGPSSGGTLVTVTGANFRSSCLLQCRFGNLSVPATPINETLVQCRSPSVGMSLDACLQVTNNGQSYSDGCLSFHFHAGPMVLSLHPQRGTIRGGTVLTLTGSHLEALDPSSLRCVIGDGNASSVSWSASDGTVTCVTPPVTAASSAVVKLSSTGVNWVVSPVPFDYVPDPVVLASSPSGGPLMGGGLLRIEGYGFTMGAGVAGDDGISCRFGRKGKPVTALEVSSSGLTCVVPASSTVGPVDVFISINNADYSEAIATYTYYADIRLASVAPVQGPSAGGTTLEIIGSGFLNTDLLACRIGEHVVPASFINSSRVACVTPALPPGSTANISLSNNGVDFQSSQAALAFDALRTPVLFSISPASGMASGGTRVAIRGENLGAMAGAGQLACLFGGVVGDAAWAASDSEVHCTTPAFPVPVGMGLAVVPVGLVTPGSEPFVSSVSFTFLEKLQVLSISPPGGPISGGTRVLVRGIGFHESAGVPQCLFGNASGSSARLLSSSELECVSQAVEAPGSVLLRLTVNHQEISDTGVPYIYAPAVRVDGVGPLRGLPAGGTEIRIQGSGFLSPANALVCSFGGLGGLDVPAYVASDTLASCSSPPSRNSNVSLTISTASSELMTVVFSYCRVPSAQRIHPASASISGGTIVNVTFASDIGSFNESGLVCRFGSLTARMNVTGARVGRCAVPAAAEPGFVVLVVEAQGSSSGPGLAFEYLLPMAATRVTSAVVPAWFASVVSVLGAGFPRSSGLSCRFGEDVQSGGVSRARWLSAGSIECPTPVLPPGSYPLYISSNAVDYEATGLEVTLHPEVTLAGARPSRSFVGGGARVVVTGAMFRDDGTMQCAFGDQVVDALYLNSSALLCVTKPHAPGALGLSLCILGSCLNETVPFTFIPPAQLAGAWPLAGGIAGGTNVTIYSASDLLDAVTGRLVCRFGSVEVPGRLLPPAEPGSTVVSCISPPHDPGRVRLALADQGSDFSSDPVSFLFYPPAMIASVVPAVVPEAGGGPIRVTGATFVNMEGLACLFRQERAGAEVVLSAEATWLSEMDITCMVPRLAPGPVEVVVAYGNETASGTRGFALSVRPSISLLELRPTSGLMGGSTVVTLTGTNFFQSPRMTCSFNNDSTPAIYLNDSAVSCVSPSTAVAGAVTVTVTLDDFSLSEDVLPFEYVNLTTRVMSLVPGVADAEGHTTIQVTGIDLLSPGACVSYVAEVVGASMTERVAMVVAGETRGSFLAPALPAGPAVLTVLCVGEGGEEQTSVGTLPLVYARQPLVLSVTPPLGIAQGGTRVKVFGRNFFPSSSFTCKFGLVFAEQPGLVLSSSEALCIAPPQQLPGPVFLQVSNNNGSFSSANAPAARFEYGVEPLVYDLFPKRGTYLGGTAVEITGNHFDSFSRASWKCFFGAAPPVPATVINSTLLRCVTRPAGALAGPQVVAVSYNGGRDYARVLPWDASQGPDLWFTFDSASVNFSLASPWLAWVGDKVNVVLSGEPAIPEATRLLCSATYPNGTATAVHAKTMPDGRVTCPVKALEHPGSVVMELSLNGADFFPVRDGVLPFYMPPTVSQIVPECGSELGNTTVVVGGFNFLPGVGIMCNFSGVSEPVSGRWRSPTEVECPSPRRMPGMAHLQVSFDSGASWTEEEAVFTFLPVMAVSRVWPASATLDGQPWVGVYGTNFVRTPGLACRFGDLLDAMPASWVNSSFIQCQAPRVPAPTVMEVGVTANGVDVTADGPKFSFLPNIIVKEMKPASGVESGGTNVTVLGNALSLATSCLFGDTEVAATPLGADGLGLSCAAPAGKEGWVDMAVTAQGVPLAHVGQFRYTRRATLLGLDPAQVVTTGGDTVMVTGMHFRNTRGLCCLVSSADGTEMLPTPAKWESSSVIYCTLPAHPPGSGLLAVSHDYLDPTETSGTLPIWFYPQPIVESIEPTGGPVTGGTVIRIRGHNFAFTSHLACRIGDRFTPAEFINSTVLLCATPASPPGPTPVQVVFEERGSGVTNLTDAATFHFMEAVPTLLAMAPQLGPLSGSTRLTLSGTDFVAGAMLCRFRRTLDAAEVGILVAASVTSESSLTCDTPAALEPGTSFVDASVDGQQFTSNILTFRYYGNISVHAVLPMRGPETGGTRVRVFGFNMTDLLAPQPSCRFGLRDEPAGTTVVIGDWIRSGVVECVTPPRVGRGLGPVFVGLSLNGGQDFVWSHEQLYNYDPAFHLVNVRPSHGWMRGGTLLEITGSGFTYTGDLACRFGGRDVGHASFVNGSLIRCLSPPATSLGTVGVEVSLNGVDFTSGEGVDFKYSRELTILGVSPSSGPPEGGTPVNVSGLGFASDLSMSSQVACLFGEAGRVPATVVSDSVLTCTTPPNPTLGPVPLRITLNGQDLTELSVPEFRYTSSLHVTSLDPAFGSFEGGDLVTVYGGVFLNDRTVCRFSSPGWSQVVPARWISASQIECRSPPARPSNAQVEVSSNGKDFSSDGIVFTYLGPPTLASIWPDSGPLGGGTPVTITGRNFFYLDKSVCRFGTEDSRVVFVSSEVVICPSPSQTQLGTVLLSLSLNGRSFLPGLPFRYTALPQLVALSPPRVFVGAEHDIVVAATGVEAASPALTCRFHSSAGVVENLGRLLNESTFTCRAPAVLVPGERVGLELSNNGLDFSNNGLYYRVNRPTRLINISPAFGSELGGTIVSVIGDNFLNVPELMCRFGEHAATAVVWQSPSEIWCTAPPNSPGPVDVAVTVNGLDYVGDTALAFLYHAQATVLEVTPRLGSREGGTVITVTGLNFLLTPLMRCAFDRNDMVPASWVSPTEVRCSTPYHIAGRVRVGVSLNGKDIIEGQDDMSLFSFVSGPSISSLTPRTGPLEGGTVLTIAGRGFNNVSTLACRFGDVAGTVVEYRSDAVVLCRTPAAKATTGPSGVAVWVSNNGVEFAMGDVVAMFWYYRSPEFASISRSSVPENAPTKVVVTGSGFADSENLSCRFGEEGTAVSPARWLSPTRMVCTSPNLTRADGPYPLYISNNGADFLDSWFRVGVDRPVMTFTFRPSGGPVTGGTVVTLVASPGKPSGSQSCRFGTEIVPAMADDAAAGRFLCRTPPPVKDAGPVAVSFSYNGWDFFDAAEPFVYMPAPRMASLTPTLGPMSGGTRITVQGEGFTPRGMVCRFKPVDGGKGRPEIVLATGVAPDGSSLICTAPTQRQSGAWTVEVSANGGTDFTAQELKFRFYAQPHVFAVAPVRGPETGGTWVSVRGFGFVETPALACRFGEGGLLAPAVWNSSELVYCVAPPHAPGPVQVALTFNGQQFFVQAGRPVTFVYDFPLQIFSMSPASGPITGGTQVTFVGPEFEFSAGLRCRFGLAVTHAVFVNRTAIVCVSPSSPQGPVSVAISRNGQDFEETGLRFSYVPQPQATWVYPAFGWAGAATRVVVGGQNVMDLVAEELNCIIFASPRVQPLTVPAVPSESGSAVSCTIPPYDAAAFGPRSVTADGGFVEVTVALALAASAVPDGLRGPSFRYLPPVVVNMVVPTFGPEQGGTKVRVFGENFVNTPGLNCTFGSNMSVAAIWVSPEIVDCVSPVHAIGSVPLTVITDGLTALSSTAAFTFEPGLQVFNVSPAFGTPMGGTRVRVTGLHFSRSSALFCRFGVADPVPAGLTSDEQLYCDSPEHEEGLVELRITANDADYSSAALSFTFVALPAVAYIVPNSGPTLGGTSVGIVGTDFVNSTLFTCQFGSAEPGVAVFVSEKLLACTSPPLGTGVDSQVTVNLYIRYNGELISEVIPVSQPQALHPRQSPAL